MRGVYLKYKKGDKMIKKNMRLPQQMKNSSLLPPEGDFYK